MRVVIYKTFKKLELFDDKMQNWMLSSTFWGSEVVSKVKLHYLVESQVYSEKPATQKITAKQVK